MGTRAGRTVAAGLVLAVVFVFGLKGGVGVERLSAFFHRVRLERYLAVSPSALRSLRTQMETVILAYQTEQERRLGQAGCRLEIIAGADETFVDEVVLVMMDLEPIRKLMKNTINRFF